MNFDARVLRATFGLASRQKTVNESEIAHRLGTTATAVRASMRRLQGADLAEMRPGGSSRLTLAGLAIALAMGSARMPRKRSWAPDASRAA
jgi:Mn-dependent DtxR family transcriptional regulator